MKRKIAGGAACWALFALCRPCDFSPYTAWMLSLCVQFWCAGHFHAGLLRGLRDMRLGISMLASLSAWALFLLNTAAVFAGEHLPPGLREPRFLSLAAMVTLVNLGLWLESLMRKKTPWAFLRLESRLPRTARVLRGGEEYLIEVRELVPGDQVVVRPGEPISIDGELREGTTLVEERLHTGIEEAVEKSPGCRLYAGSVNKGSRIVLSAGNVPGSTRLHRLFDEVRKTSDARQAMPRALDPVARAFFAAVLVVAALSAAAGAIYGPHPRPLYAAAAFLSVLSVACPWAVGLATPLTLFFGRLRAARHGIELRDPRVLESFRGPDVVLFDKTGVLTDSAARISEILAFDGRSEEDVLSLLLSAERDLHHPLIETVRRHAAKSGGALLERTSFESFLGRGVSASIDGKRLLAGSLAWLTLHGIEPPEKESLHIKSSKEPCIALAVDGRMAGAVIFSAPFLPEARAAVERLRSAGIEPMLVSGDGNAAACAAAEQAGIAKVYAEAHEDEKAALVERLQEKGQRVAVLGEGLKDCLALLRADLSFCAAGCAASAEAASDFSLARRDLDGFLETLRLGREVRAAMRRNLLWMFAVHALMLPLSAWALYHSIELGPAACAWTATASTLAVIVNSLQLLRARGTTA